MNRYKIIIQDLVNGYESSAEFETNWLNDYEDIRRYAADCFLQISSQVYGDGVYKTASKHFKPQQWLKSGYLGTQFTGSI